MARPKKNVEPIVGTGENPENMTVQKSIPLFSLWRSDMSLAEFKILDTYLSRINSHDPERRTVIFTKGELEGLLGVKRINKPDLAARLKSLGRFVDLEQANSKKIHQVALFEEAYGEMDENGQWTVKLTCTAKAMKYIFNVEKLGYLRYKLRCIVNLTSRYTYILFTYLEHNRFRKSWVVDVDELRQILNCDTEESYKEFKLFNNRILRKCQKELHEKTECRFTYEPIKSGRRVTGVRFTLESIAALPEPIEGQVSLFETNPDDPEVLCAAVLPDSFTPEEVHAIYLAALPVAPYNPDSDLSHDAQVAMFLQQKVAVMRASKKPVPHPYNYLLAVLSNTPAVKKRSGDTSASTGFVPGQAELDAIQRLMSGSEAPTAAEDPEIAARGEALKKRLQH